MRELLRDLKSILEHERAVYGRYVPLDGDGEGPSVESSTAPSAVDVETPETAAPETPDAEAAGQTEAASAPTPSEPRADAPPPESQPSESPPSDPQPTDAPTPSDDAPESTPDASMPNHDLFGNQVDPTEDPSLPPWERIEALIPDDAPYKDAESLDEVEEYLANTVLVPIDEDRKNPVFGVGDPDADLLIIGEAPGRNEDEQGEPFVGRAGQLLDKILEAIELKRSEVYIANILKSRPPRNRDPKAEEIEAHLPILYKQIALIQPKIILCVGKVAGNTMLDRRSSLKSLRQKEHDLYGIPTMVTYHPAALLRNSQWKRPTWEDMKLVRTRYDQLREEE